MVDYDVKHGMLVKQPCLPKYAIFFFRCHKVLCCTMTMFCVVCFGTFLTKCWCYVYGVFTDGQCLRHLLSVIYSLLPIVNACGIQSHTCSLVLPMVNAYGICGQLFTLFYQQLMPRHSESHLFYRFTDGQCLRHLLSVIYSLLPKVNAYVIQSHTCSIVLPTVNALA